MAESLLQRVAANDPRAVRACIERYSGLVWSLARRMSPSNVDAEDATQDIFLSLWRSAGRYDPAVAAEATFVGMIARRVLIDRYRSRRRHAAAGVAAEGMEIAAAVSEPRAEVSEEASKAASALAALQPEQQRVLRLAIYEGLSHEQIAAATGVPLGTVKTRIRRGLMKVRELLGGGVRQEVAT